jgi:hypothetical protein
MLESSRSPMEKREKEPRATLVELNDQRIRRAVGGV